jgi:hypothetical protein
MYSTENKRGKGARGVLISVWHVHLLGVRLDKSGNSFRIGSPSLIRTQRKETTLLFFELNEGAPPVRVMVTVCPPLG